MKKKSRIGRNPKTKEQVMITERNVIKFKPSSFLLNLINSNLNNLKMKHENALKTIGEVSSQIKVPVYVIMFWEKN